MKDSVDNLFETKLFSLTFDEMLRREFGAKIIKYIRERQAEEAEAAVQKRKREAEEIEERAAKVRKKYAQELVASAEKMRQDAEKEDEGSEKRDELEKKAAELQGRAEQMSTDSPPDQSAGQGQSSKHRVVKKGKKGQDQAPGMSVVPEGKDGQGVMWEVDEDQFKIFQYFDTSLNQPSGCMRRVDLFSCFMYSEDLCYREILELQNIVSDPRFYAPAGPNAQGLFSYQTACKRKVLQREQPTPVQTGATVDATPTADATTTDGTLADATVADATVADATSEEDVETRPEGDPMSADASMESFAPEHHDEEADHEDRGMEVDAREVGADDVPAQEEGSDHEEEKDEEAAGGDEEPVEYDEEDSALRSIMSD
jgi:hypothetical protein